MDYEWDLSSGNDEQFANWQITIEIVDLSNKHGDFNYSHVTNYQRVASSTLPFYANMDEHGPFIDIYR